MWCKSIKLPFSGSHFLPKFRLSWIALLWYLVDWVTNSRGGGHLLQRPLSSSLSEDRFTFKASKLSKVIKVPQNTTQEFDNLFLRTFWILRSEFRYILLSDLNDQNYEIKLIFLKAFQMWPILKVQPCDRCWIESIPNVVNVKDNHVIDVEWLQF